MFAGLGRENERVRPEKRLVSGLGEEKSAARPAGSQNATMYVKKIEGCTQKRVYREKQSSVDPFSFYTQDQQTIIDKRKLQWVHVRLIFAGACLASLQPVMQLTSQPAYVAYSSVQITSCNFYSTKNVQVAGARVTVPASCAAGVSSGSELPAPRTSGLSFKVMTAARTLPPSPASV